MDKKLVGLMLIFLLSFGLFTVATVFNKPLSRFTKAKEELIPSSQNSLLFGWPLTAKADGNQTVEINVFVRNSNNVPLENKKINLTSSLGTFKENNIATDKGGKATFHLVSGDAGIANITALIDNQVEVKQQLTIKFE